MQKWIAHMEEQCCAHQFIGLLQPGKLNIWMSHIFISLALSENPRLLSPFRNFISAFMKVRRTCKFGNC